MTAQSSEAAPAVPEHLVAPLALVEAQATARQAVTDHLVVQVQALIDNFHDWYDDLAVRRFSNQVGDLVQAAQAVAASNEDAYLTAMLRQASGRDVPPAGAIGPNVISDLRRGANPDEVYRRLAVTFRYGVSTGKSGDAATRDVLNRAKTMNDTDIGLASRAQDQKTLRATSLAVGYRRVIHPELSRGGVCGMCIVASDRTYHKEALLPIHDNCHCTVAPILATGEDPGSSINNLSLGDLYDDAQGMQQESLKRTRYQVDDHGELRAVLTPKGAYKGKYRKGSRH